MPRTCLLAISALLALGGCNAYRLDPPAGFAEVHRNRDGTRMKAGDDVGLRVSVFDNVRGGSLDFWSRDLVRKLGARGYTLEQQLPTKSKNGTVGTRFDFAYANREGEPKFYSVLLFVSDRHRVVVEVAGDAPLAPQYRVRLPAIAESLLVRGCRAGGDLCRGPQPPPLATPRPEPEAPARDPESAPTPEPPAPAPA